MTDAPEKIWHTIDRQGKISSSPDAHVEPCLEVSSSYIEYTRSDIPQARIAELRHALFELLYVQDGLPMTGIEATRRADQARAALKAKP
jgi:hypothetical protein